MRALSHVKLDVATVALHELRRAQPNFSIAWIMQNMPFEHEADREQSRSLLPRWLELVFLTLMPTIIRHPSFAGREVPVGEFDRIGI
jgi:hypothetical protein